MAPKTPPTEIYFVQSVPYEGERRPYYGLSLSRVYYRFAHVKQFLKSHPRRNVKVFKVAHVEWVEIELDD